MGLCSSRIGSKVGFIDAPGPVDVSGTAVDVSGSAVDVSGTAVDVSGSAVDVSGTAVDVSGSAVASANDNPTAPVPSVEGNDSR
jgi:hypothetical protein